MLKRFFQKIGAYFSLKKQKYTNTQPICDLKKDIQKLQNRIEYAHKDIKTDIQEVKDEIKKNRFLIIII